METALSNPSETLAPIAFKVSPAWSTAFDGVSPVRTKHENAELTGWGEGRKDVDAMDPLVG